MRGGTVPICLASTYLATIRKATYTPDENLIHDSPVDLLNMGLIHAADPTKVTIRSMTTKNIVVNGVRLPDVTNGRYEREDGLILSLCNRKNSSIARRLGKRAGVRIHDVEKLKHLIDHQLGTTGIMGPCVYVEDHRRDHFTKSTEDAWQDEFRIFWPVLRDAKVLLPAGVARRIKLKI